MTTSPELKKESIDYAYALTEYIAEPTPTRRAGSAGEEQAQRIFASELREYCDHVSRDTVKTHPGAGTLTEKLLCALLILCVILFSFSTESGAVTPAAITLIVSLMVFCAFVYKIIFDGKRLDFITPTRKSANIFGIRHSRSTPSCRVVLVGRADAPPSMRTVFLSNKAPFILAIFSLVGNTILFSGCLFFLFSGAPQGSAFFSTVKVLCLAFIPVYIVSMLLINGKKTASGISSSLLPTAVILSVFRQLSEESFRFSKMELCCLISGSEYSSRAGSYAFAKKHRLKYRDIPTIFIPIEELTSSHNLAVFFKDGSGVTGSTQVASVIGEAADNLEIKLIKEATALGSNAFTPFTRAHFSACSLGTSKRNTTKVSSATADKPELISKKTISDVGSLIIETLNYYGG